MKGITIHKDTEGQVREVRYLTDDRDARDGRRLELCIGWGNNGDWYVVTVPEGERSVSAVRLCTSGGASSAVPGFVPLMAEAFRKLAVAGGAEIGAFQSVVIRTTPPPEAQQCVLCGHGELVGKYCAALINKNPDNAHQRQFCGCHCVFSAGAETHNVEPTLTVRAQWVIDHYSPTRDVDYACEECCRDRDDSTVVDGFVCEYHRAKRALNISAGPSNVTADEAEGQARETARKLVVEWRDYHGVTLGTGAGAGLIDRIAAALRSRPVEQEPADK